MPEGIQHSKNETWQKKNKQDTTSSGDMFIVRHIAGDMGNDGDRIDRNQMQNK